MLQKRENQNNPHYLLGKSTSLDGTLTQEFGTMKSQTQEQTQGFQNFKLNNKEKDLYKIMQGYLQTQKAVEKLHPQQKSGIYAGLANLYAGLATMLDQKKDHKQEAGLLKVLALSYAQNAMGYQNNAQQQKAETGLKYH